MWCGGGGSAGRKGSETTLVVWDGTAPLGTLGYLRRVHGAVELGSRDDVPRALQTIVVRRGGHVQFGHMSTSAHGRELVYGGE